MACRNHKFRSLIDPLKLFGHRTCTCYHCHRWPAVLQQARDLGLISDDQTKGYLKLHPPLPYFLYTRLKQKPEVRDAVERAYRVHYGYFAAELIRLMNSNGPSKRLAGQTRILGIIQEDAMKLLKRKAELRLPYHKMAADHLDSHRQKLRQFWPLTLVHVMISIFHDMWNLIAKATSYP